MRMIERFDIAGYARISVDEELDRDNVSIENQKSIIEDFVTTHFPNSTLTFFEDRDRSGYTFEQREGYQEMRRGLMSHQYDILIVKDFSRFSRRNSRGLVELEDLRDAGVRIISIGDNIDFPNDDDWLKIQFQFLINEMPVTDTSKKVRSVVRRRQEEGRWLCAAPYGYILNKQQIFEVVPTEAEVIRTIFKLYLDGWGYKKIANYLTDNNVPTPRMSECERRAAAGEPVRRKTKAAWAIVTVQGILDNDFYIGTLRQGKFTRVKINGTDRKLDESEHRVFEHHHQEIIDYRTFATVRSLRESGDMTPLLVMAGHTTARARIRILNAGADNVLMRPCQSDEILAHVNALARRPRMMQSEILTAGDLTLDRGRCVLSSNDGEVRLSGKELQLVEMFLREPGQVLPREMLHEKVWGAGRDATYNNIEVYLTLVRRKLRAVGSKAELISERGIGYYLQEAE